MRVLIVCAHPDDETFGMGGTILRHVEYGDEVFILCLADGVLARGGDVKKQDEAFTRACRMYGAFGWAHKFYPDQHLDNVPLIELVMDIEKVLREFHPQVVYTHASEDVGQDHRRVNEATMVACRPLASSSVKKLLSFSCPSSTFWGGRAWEPTYFVDITNYHEYKVNILEDVYPHEVPQSPHPRSYVGIENYDKWLAQLAGIDGYAEGFRILREVESD